MGSGGALKWKGGIIRGSSETKGRKGMRSEGDGGVEGGRYFEVRGSGRAGKGREREKGEGMRTVRGQ